MADVHEYMRNSDRPRFYIWNESCIAFLFGPLDSRPNVSFHSVSVLFLRGVTTRPDEKTEGALHASELTEQISSIGLACCVSKLWFESRSSKTGVSRIVIQGKRVRKGFGALRLVFVGAPGPPAA